MCIVLTFFPHSLEFLPKCAIIHVLIIEVTNCLVEPRLTCYRIHTCYHEL